MNSTKTKQLLSSLALVFFFMISSGAYAQHTVWEFLSGDSKGYKINITTNQYQEILKVQLANSQQTAWSETSVEDYNLDGVVEYVRVKSKSSGKMYELKIFWNNTYYDEIVKVEKTNPDSSKVLYYPK